MRTGETTGPPRGHSMWTLATALGLRRSPPEETADARWHDVELTRPQVADALTRLGVSPEVLDEVLDQVRFPAAESVVCDRLEKAGLPVGLLVEWMGGSP
jgi:hypothetical protein